MDPLTMLLLIVAATGLCLSLLSLIGLDLGPIDVHIGDSGVGLLGLLTPGITIGAGVSGLMLLGDTAPTIGALAVGAAAMAATMALMYPVLRMLLRAGKESETTELAGHKVSMVDGLDSPQRLGQAEAITPNGSQLITVCLDPEMTARGLTLRPGDTAYLVSPKNPDDQIWFATSLWSIDRRDEGF
ncbi:hypothetical protein [Gordonia sp. NPDC003950]